MYKKMGYRILSTLVCTLVFVSIAAAHEVNITYRAKVGTGHQLDPGTYRVEVVKNQECRRAMNKLGARHTLGEIEQQVLMDMSHSIVNKIFAEPTKVLKEAAERGDMTLLKSMSELFRLEDRT